VYSFKHERLITLENYCDEMLENQDNIYYLASDSLKQAQSSPHLEGFKPKGLDVLLMTDPVDAFWMSQMAAFKEKPFVSISRDKYDLSKIGENDEETTDGLDETDTITTLMKERLGDVVEDVRATKSLVDSPVRLTASEGGFDFNLERILKAQNPDFEVSKKILEINPNHELIKKIPNLSSDLQISVCRLLVEQARILDGEMPSDPRQFSQDLILISQSL
jgi:molecular chaperone HtpG